jgi:predicted SnoaL-like aldol condensation-catalyzing enzyme
METNSSFRANRSRRQPEVEYGFDCEETWIETGNAGAGVCRATGLSEVTRASTGGVVVSETVSGTHGFVRFFATKKSEIEKSKKKLLQFADPGALVWIAYPKKTSGVESDLSREEVWAAMESTGWRPVSQIAIDEVWSALRFRPIQDVKSHK